MVALLASTGLTTDFRALAIVLFCLGFASILAFAVYRTGNLWTGCRSPESTTPILYFPTVAGMLVTASALSVLGQRDWGQLAFGAAYFHTLQSRRCSRIVYIPQHPWRPPFGPHWAFKSRRPRFAAVAYLNVSGGGVNILAHGLIGYGILQALIVIRLLPWIREAGLTPAWWSFSFGAAALPTAAMKLVAKGDVGAASFLAPYLFTAGYVAIAAIAMMTIILIVRGRLLPQ